MWEQEGFDWIAQGDPLCSCKYQQDGRYHSVHRGHTRPDTLGDGGVEIAWWCNFRLIFIYFFLIIIIKVAAEAWLKKYDGINSVCLFGMIVLGREKQKRKSGNGRVNAYTLEGSLML